MGRRKNESSVSADGQTQLGIVPEEEWPYDLPEGWRWVRLGDVVDVNPPKIRPDDLNEPVSFVPMASVSEVSGSISCREAKTAIDVISGFTSFRDGDVLFAKIKPCMENGKAAIASNLINGIGYGSTEFYVLRPSNIVDRHWVYYYVRSQTFRDEAKQNMSGAVGQQRVPKTFIVNHFFPLPPLSIQQHIIARIESLFAKLDEAKSLAQSALDSFETRKAAILHKAFTGELTAKWREENGISDQSWQHVTLKDVCTGFQYGTSQKSQKTGKVPVIRMGNLQNGVIEWDNLAYTDNVEDIIKYALHRDDILFNRTNSPELVGKTSIYKNEMPAIFAGYLIRINYIKSIIDGEFLNYLLNSNKAKIYCLSVKTDGVNQSNINAQKLAQFTFNKPKLSEQKEITKMLDSLFSKEQTAQKIVEDVLTQIDLMKKSILNRAFRGKL